MQYMYKCPHNKKTDRIYSCEWNLNDFDISFFPQKFISMNSDEAFQICDLIL